MSRRTLQSLFRNLAFKSRNKSSRPMDFVLLLEGIEERIVPAVLPEPTVLTPTASAASVAIARQDPTGSNNNTTIDYVNPQVVASPTNALNQVLVATANVSNGNGNVLVAVYQTTSNGGVTWTAPKDFNGVTVPGAAISTLQAVNPRDPLLASNAAVNTYTNSSSPAVAYGRDGTIYFVRLVHNTDKSSGFLEYSKMSSLAGTPGSSVRLYQWTGSDPSNNPTIAVDNNLPTFTDPQTGLTVDDPMIDPITNKSRGIYVAWNGNSATANDVTVNGVVDFNANPIMAVVSADDGSSWSNPSPVSDNGFLTNLQGGAAIKRGSIPQIVFAPATSSAPGSLVFIWPQQINNRNYSVLQTDSIVPNGGVSTDAIQQAYSISSTFTNVTGLIPDATQAVSPATFDTPSSKSFTLNVTNGVGGTITDPNFSLQDISVNMSLVAPFLTHMRVTLTAPNGNSINLINNRILGDGSTPNVPANQPFASGITSPGYTPSAPQPPDSGVGVQNGVTAKTVFSDTGARRINDPNSSFPYVGVFRAEGNGSFTNSTSPPALILNTLGYPVGTSAATLAGTWKLTVTDVRFDNLTLNSAPYTAREFLSAFGLTFSSVPRGMSTDSAVNSTTVVLPSVGTDFNNNPLTGLPTAPSTGIAPSFSAAFDQSMGTSSPFAGQLYIAYTKAIGALSPPTLFQGSAVIDTDIGLIRGSLGTGASPSFTFGTATTVNDDAATDDFTQGPAFDPASGTQLAVGRPQFLPAVTVDSTTGTVVVSWMDTRLDANKTRAATFIATSINGGSTFSDQTTTTSAGTQSYLNQPKNALDLITGTTYTLQPVASNIPQSNANGVGFRQSLIVSGGKIYAYWPGNSNSAGNSIMSARAVTASGPRVVGGDMGPVTSASTVGPFTYNASKAADGTRGLDGLVVSFDRLLDLTTVTTSAFTIQYRNPYDSLSVAPTLITPTAVTVISSSTAGTTVLVRFAPQYKPGTYSYAVAPTIRDMIHTVVTGNPMDQNANSVTAESNVDSFAMPNPTNGIPFTLPYASATLPLILPGPSVISTSVTNGGGGSDPNLVLAGVATSINITFDRNMNTNPANGPVFGPSNIVRLTGPSGVIYDRSTATSNPLTVTSFNPTTFRVGFPAQVLSGTYTIEIDPLFAADVNVQTSLGANRPSLVDTNQNAGFDVLSGGATPSNGTPSSTTYTATFNGTTTPVATIPAQNGGVNSVTEFPINVPDIFAIAISQSQQIRVQINVSSTNPDNTHVTDLVGELVAPDGTTIRLFTNVGNTLRAPGTLWFSNTTFVDSANTPIQNGFQPFDQGPYNPQFPLSTLNGLSSQGTWKLRIINSGSFTPALTSWSLVLPKISGGTGLGETVADRISVNFRIFNQNPIDSLTQQTWTPVGPAPEFNPNSGDVTTARTNGLAVDPSDPSGNTVYLGGASGGIWKTTNFLTKDAGGPQWIPLTDMGPSFSLNIVSIAVFPRNNDPSQSIIFAATGEGDTGTQGVGVLRSMDGGRTWVVLDSTNNSDTAITGGNVTPITATTRDRAFFGATSYKVIVDPKAVNDADKNAIVYLANGLGVWRSVDTGRHWTRIRSGTATDIVLAAGSADKSTGNLQILYAAFQGSGVFRANPAYAATSMTQLTGTPTGNGNFVDFDRTNNPVVPIGAPSSTPNGAKGRIVLAAPALTNQPLQDQFYQGWLYALVVASDGNIDGLYITKDFGANWTKVSLARYSPKTGFSYGTNDYTQPDHNPFGGTPPLPSQGNYDVAIAIDPQNPNVVYIGGTNDGSFGPAGTGSGGLIRVDITGVMDALAVVAYDNGAVDGNTLQFTTNNGNIVTKPAGTTSQNTAANLGPGNSYGLISTLNPFGSIGYDSVNRGLLNVLRDPSNPFLSGSTLGFTNVASIQNKGTGARFSFFPAQIETDVHRIITFVDQATGLTRVIVGDDQGVASVVDDGMGTILSQVGTSNQVLTLPSINRNGNLQTVQLYSGTAQPGQLAAEIAQAMFYGMAQDDGFPVSNSSILQTGLGDTANHLSWTGITGDGSWVLTDPTGSGTAYQYRWPCCANDGLPASEFFRVISPGTEPSGVGRTLFLVQPGDVPGQGQGQWPLLGGAQFTVNPVDSNGLMISSPVSGRLFRSTDQGRTWFVVGGDAAVGTNPLDGRYAPALAFGAPDPANPNQLNNFLYAGTAGGKIFVSFNGGGASWTDISNGLDGSAIQQIIADPVRGSKDVYAVTANGVYFKTDSSTTTAWVRITGNLFTITRPIFGDANSTPGSGEIAMLRSITSIAVDWRYTIPDTSSNAPSAFFPVLYVGGYGGVFRSLDRGKTWQVYPVGSNYNYTDPSTGLPAVQAIPDGGYLPSVEIRQLTLSLGNIDPATGQPLQQTGGLNMLTAATYGRGTWVIRLEDFRTNANPAIANLANFQSVEASGPRVIGVTETTSATTYRVQFNSPVLATTFTPGSIVFKDALGNIIPVTSITPIVDSTGPANYPAVPGNPADYHDLFRFTLASVPAPGFAEIVIGPNVSDYAGYRMNQNNNLQNGETTADPNNGGAAADAYHAFLFVTTTAVKGNLFIDMPTVTTAGDPTKVIVTAINPLTGLPLTTFTGTISFSTSDPLLAAAGLPANYTFTVADAGTHTFTIVFKTAALPPNQTRLSVTDLSGTLSQAQSFITVNPGAVSKFILSGISNPASAGVANTFTVTATDLFGNLSTGYNGKVTFTTTDPSGTFASSNYTFTTGTGGDNGVHTFVGGVTLQTVGSQTVTATDATNPNIVLTGSQTVSVVAGPAASMKVTGFPSPTVAGVAGGFTVTLFDAFGNVATGFTDKVSFTTSDPQGTFTTTTYTFTGADAGTHLFSNYLTLRTAGTRTLTVSDTTVPTLKSTQTGIVVLPAATSQLVIGGIGSSVIAGVGNLFSVSAQDAFGNVTPSYVGSVSLTTTDSKGTLAPQNYTFKGSDKGVATFTSTLVTAGNQTITAKDTINSLMGTSSNILVLPAAASTIQVTGSTTPIVAGTPNSFTLTLFDAFGNLATNYVGTVQFTSSDPQASFTSSTYTFTGADAGTKSFANGFTLRTAGNQSLTATDTSNGSLTGTESPILVNAAAAVKLLIINTPASTVAGVSKNFVVEFTDPFGNVVPGYTGTVTLSSSDANASFTPQTYTFQASDNGTKQFSTVLTTIGNQTVTANDFANGLSATSSNIAVTSAPAASVVVSGFPSTIVAGAAGSYTVSLFDAFNNPAQTYTGSVSFSSDDILATFLPSNYTFTLADAGKHTFTNGATLRTAGTHSITVTDTANSLVGQQTSILVTPATTSKLVFIGAPTSATAGVGTGFTLAAEDAYGNVTPAYTGTVTLTTTDPRGALVPASYTFTGSDNGSKFFDATFFTSGSTTVTANDAGSLLTTKSAAITVNAAPAAQITIGSFPSPIVAGVAGSYSVTVTDAFGNVATSYLGTINVSTDDTAATLLTPNYTFTATDAGQHVFTNSATFRTAGTHSITVTDSANGFINSQTGITVNAAAASKLLLSSVTPAVVAGDNVSLTATLTDAFNNIVTAYVGTVRLTSTDGLASFVTPTYTFTPSDAGKHTFTGVLRVAGNQTITVNDATSKLQATTPTIVVSPAATSAFVLTGIPTSSVAGATATPVVQAIDAFGNITPAYTGTVNFTSTDLKAVLPTNYTFTGADAGVHSFTNAVSLRTAGTQSLTVTDTNQSGLSSTLANLAVSPAGVSKLVETPLPSPITAGTNQAITVTAQDPFGNTVKSYTGTVAFSSTDPLASLPGNYSFQASDAGTRSFNVKLLTAGNQSVTTTDSAASLSTVLNTKVNAAQATKLVVTGLQNPTTFNLPQTLTIVAQDPFGNVDTSYNQPVTITTTDPNALTPTTTTLSNGVGQFTVTLRTAGTQTVQVSDVLNTILTSTQNVSVSKSTPPPPTTIAPTHFTVGSGSGGSSSIFVYDNTGTQIYSIQPFGPNFTSGIRVSTADVTGDGVDDYVVGSGPGGASQVVIIDGSTKKVVQTINPFEASFTGGVFVATGDITGDGISDFVITPDEGGGPRARVFRGKDYQQIDDFFGIADPNFRGGARAAIGDMDKDGFGELIVAAGFGGGPRVSGYDGRLLSTGIQFNVFGDFFAFGGADSLNLRNGVYIAMGDLTGTGAADLVVGAGPGGGPRVLAYSASDLLLGRGNGSKVLTDFFAGTDSNRGGVQVGVKNLDGDLIGDIVAAPGPGDGSSVKAYKGSTLSQAQPTLLYQVDAFNSFNGGVYVG